MISSEEIEKYPRKKWANSSEVSFDSSEVSFDSSEVSFDSSEVFLFFFGGSGIGGIRVDRSDRRCQSGSEWIGGVRVDRSGSEQSE